MALHARRIAASEALPLREIRLAALSDAPFAFARTHAEEASLPYSFWADRAAGNAQGIEGATFIALDDRSWLGLVGAYRPTNETAGADRSSAAGVDTVELVSMWVTPAGRGRGVGDLLVDAVLDWARGAGATRISLWVTEGNLPAIRLYERAGFTIEDAYKPLPSDPCRNERRMSRPVSATC